MAHERNANLSKYTPQEMVSTIDSSIAKANKLFSGKKYAKALRHYRDTLTYAATYLSNARSRLKKNQSNAKWVEGYANLEYTYARIFLKKWALLHSELLKDVSQYMKEKEVFADEFNTWKDALITAKRYYTRTADCRLVDELIEEGEQLKVDLERLFNQYCVPEDKREDKAVSEPSSPFKKRKLSNNSTTSSSQNILNLLQTPVTVEEKKAPIDVRFEAALLTVENFGAEIKALTESSLQLVASTAELRGANKTLESKEQIITDLQNELQIEKEKLIHKEKSLQDALSELNKLKRDFSSVEAKNHQLQKNLNDKSNELARASREYVELLLRDPTGLLPADVNAVEPSGDLSHLLNFQESEPSSIPSSLWTNISPSHSSSSQSSAPTLTEKLRHR